MAFTKSKIEYFTTKPGRASSVFLNEPSTKFNADGVYSCKISFEPDEIADEIARFDRLIDEKMADVIKQNPKVKKLIKPVKPYKPEMDDAGDETGKLTLNFKRVANQKVKDTGKIKVNKVKLLDTDGKAVTEQVWSGSTLMARYFITPYFSEKDKEVGLSLKLTHVTVVDLVSGGSNDGDQDLGKLGFAKVEGYKAKAGASDTPDDESGNGEASDEDPDF